MLNGQPPVIYGDGTQTRDFIFVKDVVFANILAMGCEANGVFNVGAGMAVSIKELASLIVKHLGADVDVVHGRPRVGDIRQSMGDISKAKKILGFEPRMA